MEIEFIILIGVIAFILGGLLTYLFQKSISVPRNLLEKAKKTINTFENDLSIKNALLEERKAGFEEIVSENKSLKYLIDENNIRLAQLSANLESKCKAEEEGKAKIDFQEKKAESLNNMISDLKAMNSKFSAEKNAIQEKLSSQKREIAELGKKSLTEFENLANKIFEEKTTKFSKISIGNLDQVLNPLKENLKDFKKKVEETYDKESKERFSLEAKIKELVNLNQQISKDANNLTNALKGEAKTQGNWGEMILESILEHSGLVKNREYFTQESFVDDNGKRKQPDVIIKYPNSRQIIVDSKVSLTAYERFANCTDSEKQKIHLKNHITSLRAHIDNLSSKEYDSIEKSLDFVMLFVPIEPAYMTAIHYDQELWSYAYKKRILLISPTNLIAALKMVADIWKKEHQNKNAFEIAKRGEKLYDKFIGFLTSMEGIESSLSNATKKYDEAMNRLSTGKDNLISQAKKLKRMGLNPKKSLPNKFDTDENI